MYKRQGYNLIVILLSVSMAWSMVWGCFAYVKHITAVDTIYKECDYITVHVPLLDNTRGMINKEVLNEMKDGVVILNFARDLLVNEIGRAHV